MRRKVKTRRWREEWMKEKKERRFSGGGCWNENEFQSGAASKDRRNERRGRVWSEEDGEEPGSERAER
jgi:hypothetical protein